MISRKRSTGWDQLLRRLLPGWFLAAWGREVTDMLRTEESAARSRGRTALLRFRVTTIVDLLRAASQTRHRSSAGLSGDVRLALRLFRRSPGFTCVAVLSLAIGVALSATAFSVLDPAYSRPLQFPHADRLMIVSVATVQGDVQRNRRPSYGQFRAWQAEAAVVTTSTDALVAYRRLFQPQEAPGGVEDPFADILVQSVSPDFLSVMGAAVSRGRSLTLDDHKSGAPPVVVIADRFWRRRLDGRADVLGTNVKVNGAGYTVVGVLSPDFHFGGGNEVDVIRPMVPGTNTEPAPGEMIDVVARLREGAAVDRMTAELGAVLSRDRKPDSRTTAVVLAEPIRSRLYGWAPAAFGPFVGAAALLLLLVTANVANLTLVRASGRRQEMALRTALGAGRGRLARLVAIEAGMLTLAASALGLFLSWWTIDLLVSLNPRGAGGMHPVFDLRAAAFGIGVAGVTGTLAALWPGLTVLRRERPSALRQGPQQGTDSPRQRFSQRALVMCQIGCALVVLTGAGLLGKTVLRMQSYDPGVDARGLLSAELDLPEVTGDSRGNLVLAHRLLDELRAISGVTSAGIFNASSPSAGDSITVQSKHGGERTLAIGSTDRVAQISAGYLEALGVPLIQGRMLTPEEFDAGTRGALVNEEAVRRWWPGEADIVGTAIKFGNGPWTTVVGVVRNTRSLAATSVASAPAARIFVPLVKTGSSMRLYARTVGEPLAVLPALHARALAIDRRIRILMSVDARAQLDWEVSQHRETATFVGGLAAFGLLLAAMGIYGVTTYAVARRLREIGIRKALGASTGHVVVTISRETAALAVGGIAIGLGASAALTRLLDGMLYGTSPLDAWVFAGASLLILGIVALATWIPMRTALRVDPMTTLRCE